MQKGKKLKAVVFYVFQIIVIIAAIYSLYKQSWLNLFFSVSTFVLMYFPSMIEKHLEVDYPEEFEILIMVFIFASLFLGEFTFYKMFWWWDAILHGLSGLIIATFAFSLVYILNRGKKIRLNPFFVALFSFCFAVALGALWEIFEFTMDQILNINMQKSGLVDTMQDLILDSIGALIISMIGFFYLKGRLKILDKIGKEFVDANKVLFGKGK